MHVGDRSSARSGVVATSGPTSTSRADYCFDHGASTTVASTRCVHGETRVPCVTGGEPCLRVRAGSRRRRCCGCLCPKSAVPPVPARLLLLCLLFRSSRRRVDGDRHVGAAGVLQRRGGRAALAVRVGVAPSVPKRLSLASRSADHSLRPAQGGELRSTPNGFVEHLRPDAARWSLFAQCELRRVAMLVG